MGVCMEDDLCVLPLRPHLFFARAGIKKRVNIEQLASGLNKQRVIEKAVFDELVEMLDSGVDPKKVELKKGRPAVVMFVGLQGSGKTTTCTK